MEGIYLINKPSGLSSYDCIRHFKKYTKEKIGHAGTLDPLASGLLIVLVGRATKLSNKFINYSKVYEGEITFGSSTNTYDSEGEIVNQLNDFSLTKANVVSALKNFDGQIKQKPPLYSAVKVKGRKLYHYALKGEDVLVKERDAFISYFDLTSELINNKVTFKTKVSKGTYIRSLAHDLGVMLNVPAHLSCLKRTESEDFNLEDAYLLEEVTAETKPSYLIEEYLSKYPKLVVEGKLENLVKNGIYLTKKEFKENSSLLVYNKNGQLLAYYEQQGNKYKPIIIWSEK